MKNISRPNPYLGKQSMVKKQKESIPQQVQAEVKPKKYSNKPSVVYSSARKSKTESVDMELYYR